MLAVSYYGNIALRCQFFLCHPVIYELDPVKILIILVFLIVFMSLVPNHGIQKNLNINHFHLSDESD